MTYNGCIKSNCAQFKKGGNMFYDYEARDMDDEVKSMSDYKGKVVLIVNTASK